MFQTTFLLNAAYLCLKTYCNSALILFKLVYLDWIAVRLALWGYMLCIIVLILLVFSPLVVLYAFDYLLFWGGGFITCVL